MFQFFSRSKKALRRSFPLLAFLFSVLPLLAAAGTTVLDATRAGVIGDGTTLNTAAIQQAIDSCAASGGGTILFPAGRYLTGTIQIKSNVTLRLADHATLLGSTNVADYRNLDPFVDGNGHPLGHALLVALDAVNVGLEGNGAVDGQSPKLKATQKPYAMRPFLLRFVRCANVTVRDVHLANPGSWTLNFFETSGAIVDGVTIRSRGLGMPNNDGIDLDSSDHVQVRACDINSGDDAIVIKSTSAARPSRDLQVVDCKLSSNTNAIKLGTESIGGFANISVANCTVTNTKMSGLALYTVDGGDLANVTIGHIAMDGVTVPISIRLGARLKTFRAGDQPRSSPGRLHDVTIENVTAKNIALIGMLINGVPGHPIENLTLKNIQLELPGGGTAAAAKIQLPEKPAAYPEYNMFGKILPASAIYARHVHSITFDNVQTTLLTPDARPAIVFIDVTDITPPDFATQTSGSQ